MEQNKLFMDARNQDQPANTYPYGKNGIQHDLVNTVFNEPGFRKLASMVVPYHYNGVILTGDKPVIFSTNNTNSAIGYFNPETELYEPIIDDGDAAWTFGPIGLTQDHYVTGQAQRNYKGQIVIAFTDKDGYPKYLNCDDPSISSIDDLRLFPFFTSPDISVSQITGGLLAAGAYYVAIGYERNDGTSTPYSSPVLVLVTPGDVIGTTNKALQITIRNADTDYDSVRVAIIAKVNGETTAVELTDFYPVSGSLIEFTYTGENLTTAIDIRQILTPPAIYSKAKYIGQLNDYLYIGDLELEPDLNDMQPYALSVKIECVSELVNATAPSEEQISGKKKGLMHEEVYALYIRYRKTRGGFTKWFVIAGNTPQSADLLSSSEASAGGSPTSVPKFKVEDTIPYFNALTKTIGTGVWQNATERYPDTADFDATTAGGRNLRGQLVLHHKMPTLRWCKDNLYNGVAEYGKTQLDLLGIRAVNVRIPDKYIDIIDGYEIGYALRTVGNMSVYGQSLLLHGVTSVHNQAIATGTAPMYTTGGNWTSHVWHGTTNDFDDNNNLQSIRFDTMRLHAFDILLNKPAIEPDFLSKQFKLRRDKIRTEGYFEDSTDGDSYNIYPTVFLVDYTVGSNVPQKAVTNGKLRHIRDSFYLANNINASNMINSRHEATFAGYLDGSNTNWILNYNESGVRVDKVRKETLADQVQDFEESFLVNLIAVKTDVYSNFYSQRLVSLGTAKVLTDSTPYFGGDTFVSDYTFHTYGRHDPFDQYGQGIVGKKTIRRFVCESVSNIALRYEIPGNMYTKWYPRTSIVKDDPEQCYITNFDRAVEPNQFGYSKDFNAVNDLISSVTYNPFREELTSFPFRIHRLGKQDRQSRPRSWRTALPLDYYEMQKNMGAMANISSLDDKLIIHMENALFLTQDKTKLESDVLSITLGTADIFQFEPQMPVDTEEGYAGTQHDLACIKTPIGYIFPDAKQGELYLLKGTVTNLGTGINNFLREFLNIKEKNIFNGNGITMGWDQKYKRILLSVKNVHLNTNDTRITDFSDTPAFWNALQPGDVVRYKNRLIEYVGLNDSAYDCPADEEEDVITWQASAPFCLTKESGGYTGYVGYTKRIRLTNGVADGYSENNTTGGTGTYFPPVKDETACPPADPIIEWIGKDGYCLQSSTPTCNSGYTLSDDESICVKITETAATPPSIGGTTAQHVTSNQWNNGGARVFGSYDATGQGIDFTLIETPHFWVNGDVPFDAGSRNTTDSRMNAAGIWVTGETSNPVNEWIGFSYKFELTEGKDLYCAIAADDMFRLKINGATKVLVNADGLINGSANFNYLNIYKVTGIAGTNYIEMEVKNTGSIGGLVAEVYDNTLTELQAATAEADLDIVFSTKNKFGQPIDLGTTIGSSCTTGYVYDAEDDICRLIETQTPTPGPNTGFKGFLTRCKKEDGVETGFCEPNTEDGEGPLVGEVFAPEQCTPVESTDPVEITGSLHITCTDDACTKPQGTAVIKVIFDSPVPIECSLLVGKMTQTPGGIKRYTGEDIGYTPPVGATQDPYYGADSNLPFEIMVPAGATEVYVTNIFLKNKEGQSNAQWVCQNCLYPVKKLWVKLDYDADTLGTYELTTLTSLTSGVTIEII